MSKELHLHLHVTLVDLDETLAEAARRGGWFDDEGKRRSAVVPRDLRHVELTPGTAVVCPCNSLGELGDGGVAFTLSRFVFPGVEARVRAAFERYGERTSIGRPFMPIGSAAIVATQREDVALVAAPAMWTTQNVRGTRNAYHATFAALECVERYNASMQTSISRVPTPISRVLIPGVATGRGMMSPDETMRQMTLAHDDFAAGRGRRYARHEIDAEQRPWPENAEFSNA